MLVSKCFTSKVKLHLELFFGKKDYIKTVLFKLTFFFNIQRTLNC